jgi:hypothetical protein
MGLTLLTNSSQVPPAPVPSWVIVLTALLDHVFARYLSVVAGLDRDPAERSVHVQLPSVRLRSPYKPRTSCPTAEAILYPSTDSHATSANQSSASTDVAALPAVGGDKLAALRLKSLNEHVSALLVVLFFFSLFSNPYIS